MAKANNYGISSKQLIEAIARSEPGKLEIDLVGDFIPAIADAALTGKRRVFERLINAYLSFMAKNTGNRGRDPIYSYTQAVEFAGGLCQLADVNYGGVGAFEMFQSHLGESEVRSKIA